MSEARRHILTHIRDQAKLLGEAASGGGGGQQQQQPHAHVWSAEQWWEAFQFLFVSSAPVPDSAHHDDLLFFVKAPGHPEPSPPFFVRRKARRLPDELHIGGRDFAAVAWPATVLLNVVLQSQYQLTVVACGREALPFVAEGRTWSRDVVTVTKAVFASPTVTAVNLDSSRAEAANPQPCYPDICFAVDNFDDAFGTLVLEDEDRCYCVVLHAILDQTDHEEPCAGLEAVSSRIGSGRAAAATAASSSRSCCTADAAAATASAGAGGRGHASDAGEPGQPQHGGGHAAAAAATAPAGDVPWQIGTRKRTLFAGYVSFRQILDFLDGGGSGGGGGLNLLGAIMGGRAQQQQQQDKVVMTGPGGVGRCEVAVTKLEQQQQQPPGSHGGGCSSSESGGGDPAAAKLAAAAGAASTSQLSGGGSPAQPPPAEQQQQQQQQQGLLQRGLQRGLQRARLLASGVQAALADANGRGGIISGGGGSCTMQCAMMLLKLPVRYLAHELLDGV